MPPRCELIQHESKRKNVAGARGRFAPSLFRRHVIERAARPRPSPGALLRRAIPLVCDSEVQHYQDSVLANHQILWLDVTMDVVALVRGCERLRDLPAPR